MGTTTSSIFSPKKSVLEEKREEIFNQENEKIVNSSVQALHSSCDCSCDGGIDRLDETDSGESIAELGQYQYPFENLIFEGGGNKGFAYCGAIKCLEEMNIMPQIKRFGGTSAGAITAALLALGYGWEDIQVFMSEDVKNIFLDHSYGYLSLLPNLIRGWGWNPGTKIYQWLGDKFQAKVGNPDLTFYELYKEKGVELCIVVTNLNQMRTEYCHPKSTPTMIIREALRMSMSIPIVFMACVYDKNGQKDTYVDGGVLCNFPIQCFDGWLLSMDKKDSFLLQMQKLDEMSQQFSVRSVFQHSDNGSESLNRKSIGFLLYEDTEVELMKTSLDKRKGALEPSKPTRATTLYRKKFNAENAQQSLRAERDLCQKAAESFMKALLKHNIDDEMFIDKEELKNALEDELVFSNTDRERLFGKNISVDEVFDHLDKDGNGQIDFVELIRFLEEKNLRIQKRIMGYHRTEITNLLEFAAALESSWTMNMKHVYVGEEDIKRTVGINTGHVGTADYELENEDREFLINRGYNATLAFLRCFITDNSGNMVKKTISDVSNSKTGNGVESQQPASVQQNGLS